MKIDKFLTSLILITVLAIGGVIYMANVNSAKDQEVKSEMTSEASISVNESSYDWGDIGIDDGNVEKTFQITNDGSDTLKLFEITTSCMCTTARLSLDEQESPEFGMHDKSDYVLEIPPGKTAELTVTFDPAFHGPSGVGPINRQISVKTNSSEKPTLQFLLTAMVRR